MVPPTAVRSSLLDNAQPHLQHERTPKTHNDGLDLERQILRRWLLATSPASRSARILTQLYHETLVHGLTELRQRIVDLADLDIKLHHRYASLLPNKDVESMASDYIGWCWVSSSGDVVEDICREDLEKLVWRDVALHDKIADSVRSWKMKIDWRIVRK